LEIESLRRRIEELAADTPQEPGPEDFEVFERFKGALNCGQARAAEPDPESPSGWRVNAWVKKGILLGFRLGRIVELSVDGPHGKLPFFDRHTYPVRPLDAAAGVRVVPGGSSVRDGVYLGRGVICMPPMYINIGA
jgi:2,3,4,5-tetrahydropyridine-2-carboxylate N-succinyltransferase